MAHFRTTAQLGAVLAGLAAAGGAMATPATFSDTTFNNSDYTLGAFADPSVTVNAYGQTTTGGDPGSALQGLVSSPGNNAQGVLLTALNNNFVYDPGVSGAINTLDVSLDRFTNPIVGGVASRVGSYSLRVLADQDGQLYQATFVFGPFNAVGGTWNLLSQNNIAASDFTQLNAGNFAGAGTVGGLNFDGDAITFGFAMRGSGAFNTDGSLSSDPQTNDLRADNFTVNINGGAPEPQAWALMILGLGSAGLALRAQRRRRTLA